MSLELSYYNTAATICGKVYLEIKSKILLEFYENNVDKLDILLLIEYGNKRIIDETNIIFKKVKDKGIASPVSISLNNCIGNYIYDYNDLSNIYNSIHENDIIKINLGVVIDGCIANLCETFTIKENKKVNKTIHFLDSLQKSIMELFQDPDNTNDDVRMLIESKCTNKDVFPIENCTSFQQEKGLCKYDESKYMILNYKKKYDLNDELIGLENICFEYLENEVYTIDISVVESDCDVTYTQNENIHLYRFNDSFYGLKLKSSREFTSIIKSKHNNYLFDINPYTKYGFGIKECVKKGILEECPIIYVKEKLPVITKRFTIYITENDCKLLKYKL